MTILMNNNPKNNKANMPNCHSMEKAKHKKMIK